jgi:Flp pilus assembly protein CpaB
MSRRARAAGFLLLAAACAAAAGALASGYGTSVKQAFGPLRAVVVTSRDLPAGRPIGPVQLSRWLELRRVPTRFVPPDAVAIPRQALGRVPAASVPAGSYLLAAQLRTAQAGRVPSGPRLGRGRRPVEISVGGGEAILAAGGSPEASRVDVVVTSEPRGPGPGRTYIAASGVRLVALSRQDPAGPGPANGWAATLALTRDQALRLIEAESFARAVRLLPRPG